MDKIKKHTRKQMELFFENNNEIFSLKANESIKQFLSSSRWLKKSNGKIIITEDFISNEIPNVYRYSLKKEDNKFSLYVFEDSGVQFKTSEFNDHPCDLEKNLPVIFLLLESPHKDEYSNSFVPIAPAQGKTGLSIFNKLDKILNIHYTNINISNHEYKILIMNPIPFQTSLFYLHKQPLSSSSIYITLRNNVWKYFWEQDDRYKQKLKALIDFHKPELILNCCTSKLSPLVNKFLIRNTEAQTFILDHPSSWGLKKTKDIKFELLTNEST